MPRFLPLSSFAVLTLLASCGDPQPTETRDLSAGEVQPIEYSVVDVVHDAGLAVFLGALESAGVSQALQRRGPYTVFAPSDEAFAHLPPQTLDRLQQEVNRDALHSILTYHIIPRSILSGQLDGDISLETINGESLTINATDRGLTLTDATGTSATVVSADLEADNGVVHVIDRVMLPASPEDLMVDPVDETAGPPRL
jgi:uncharacterized surface protein with fasciclin (FAS1) repeats